MRRSFFDDSGDLLRPGGIYRVARTCDLCDVTLCSRSVPTLQIGVDRPVFECYDHPARLTSPRRVRDNCLEIVSQVEDLRIRHERGLEDRQIRSKVLMKLCRSKICETVRSLLDCRRLAQVAREALAVIRFVLASIRHVRSNEYQTSNGRQCARLGN